MNFKDYPDADKKTLITTAVEFSGMTRTKKGIKKEVVDYFLRNIEKILEAESKEKYSKIHKNMCEEMIKKGEVKYWSYAAKFIDTALKLLVYYAEKGKIKKEWLYSPIDRRILQKLDTKVDTIKKVNKDEYEKLQKKIRKEAEKKGWTPIRYENWLWQKDE